MSGRRAARQSSTSGGGGGGGSSSTSSSSNNNNNNNNRITDDQIINLISKLQQLLPEIPTANTRTNRRTSTAQPKAASATKVLQETCNYIKNLHREVDDLSDRLSHLLSTIDADSAEAAIIRSLIQ